MATRTRKPPQSAASEDMFEPNAVATTAPTEEQFYDSADEPEVDAPEVDAPEQEDDDPSAAAPLGKTVAGMTEGTQAAAAELREYIRRMGNLAEEKQAVADDIKELKKEIKGKGYDTKAFDLIMKLSGMSDSEKQSRREQNVVNATYADAVGIDEDLL